MSHPEFTKANRHISAEIIRDAIVEMVDIASPTGRESAMAHYLRDRLKSAGLDTDLQFVETGRPNVVAHLRGRGTGANFLFTGHMDTSYSGEEEHLIGPGFKPKAILDDGWVWGLGANNMKSGLAAVLVAVEAIVKAGIKLDGDVSFGAVVGEIEKAPVEEFQGPEYSGYGAGSKYLVTHGVTADYALLAEPTGLRICIANMGAIWVRITISGTVAHSAFADRPNVINAIAVMHELQNDILKWAAEYQERHHFMNEHANITIACIRGGAPWRLSRNPHECSLYLDIRTVPGQTVDQVKRELRAVLRGFAERTGMCEPSTYYYVTDPPVVIDERLLVVEALEKAQTEFMGEKRRYIIRRPGADAVHFAAYGIPCVVFGPGGRTHPQAHGGAMHAVGEHVFIDDVVASARIYLATALNVCSRSST